MIKKSLILLLIASTAFGYFEISNDIPTIFSFSGEEEWRLWSGSDEANELFNNSSGILFDDGRESIIIGKFTPGAEQEAVTTMGFFAGQGHFVGTLCAFGTEAGQYNSNIDGSSFGYTTGRYNTGSGFSGFGASAGYANEGDGNTALGAYSFNTFTQDAGLAKAIDTVDFANNQVVVNGGHSFGANNTYRNLVASTSDTFPDGLTGSFPELWQVVDSTTLVCISQSFTDVGVGTLTLTPRNSSTIYENSTAVGVNAEPDADLQVMLGSTSVTEVKTTGSLTAPSATLSWLDLTTGLANPAYNEGRVFYDDDEKTLAVYNNESDVTLQLGQEMYIRATNKTGSTITNGQLVYIDGAQGNRPTIDLAKADSTATCGVIAMATHDILNNATGFVTTEGIVHDIDTDGLGVGSDLYLSASVAGDYTVTAPTAPSFVLKIGTVIVDSLTEGDVCVHITSTGVCETMVIHDVDINTDLDVAGDTTLGDEATDTLDVTGVSRFGDGGTTDYTRLSSTGHQTMAGAARVKKHLQGIVISGFGANAPTSRITEAPFLSWTFNVNDDSHETMEVPKDMDVTESVDIVIHWYTTDATADGVDSSNWQAQWNSRALGETVNAGATTDTSGDVLCGAQYVMVETTIETIPANSITQGDHLGLDITRIALVGGTNPTPSATSIHLLSIEIEYTANKLGEAVGVELLLLEDDTFLLLEDDTFMILEI